MLKDILARTTELGFAMGSEPRTGTLLRALAASKPGGSLLELGTGTGIATAWLRQGMDPAARLTSVDTDAEVQQVARTFLAEDARLKLVLEDGTDFLRGHQPDSYDLVFADAMPGKYEALENCLRLITPGGFYIIDDMLPQPNWPEGHAAKVPVLMRQLAAHPRLTLAPITWSSGIVLAVKH